MPKGNQRRPIADHDKSAIRTLLLASVPGLIVALAGAGIQFYAQRQTTHSDRRVAALKEYSSACNRYAGYLNTMERMLRMSMIGDDAKTPPATRKATEEMLGEVGRYQEEGTAAVSGLLAARDMVNALFREQVDPFAEIGPGVDVSGWKDWATTTDLAARKPELLKSHQEHLKKLLANCRATVERLGDRVQ